MSRGEDSEVFLLQVLHETEKGWLVCEDEGEEFWLPKSQVVTDEVNRARKGATYPIYEFEIPGWLAMKHDLS